MSQGIPKARVVGILLLVGLVGFGVYCSMPHGFGRLTELEKQLDTVTANESSLADVQSEFNKLGMKYELSIASGTVFDDGRGHRLTSEKRQLLLWSIYDTGAWQGPCGIQLRVYLLFDENYRISKKQIIRFRMCP